MSIAMSAPPTANTHPRPLSGRFEMTTAPTTENAMEIATEMETNISDVSVSSSNPTGMADGRGAPPHGGWCSPTWISLSWRQVPVPMSRWVGFSDMPYPSYTITAGLLAGLEPRERVVDAVEGDRTRDQQ